jgi:predicted RNase H-like HicB family nuclease
MNTAGATLDRQNAGAESVLSVILEKTATNWCAYTPDDIGVVVATGQTRDEVVENFRSALRSHLEVMADEGLPVPAITELAIKETAAL